MDGITRVIVTGDSISTPATIGGWPDYFAVESNGQYMVTWNDSVGNTTLAQMNARFDSIPKDVRANVVMIQGGTNSPGVTVANRIALENLVGKSIDRGAVPEIHAIPPKLDGTAESDWNFWQANYAAKKGIRFYDKWADIMDPATGGIAPAYARDVTHPNSVGQLLAARKLLALRNDSDNGSVPFVFPLQRSNVVTGQIGFLTNPLNLTGTGGLGTSWTTDFIGPVGATSIPTQPVAVLPAVGNTQRFQDGFLYATGPNQYVRHTKKYTTASALRGHRILIAETIKLNALTQVQPNSVILETQFAVNGGGNFNSFSKKFNAVGMRGILLREFVLPSTTAFGEIYLNYLCYGGDGTLDIELGNNQIYDLTALGLA